MARGLSRPIGHILAKNRSIVDAARAQITASKQLCSTSRDLIGRIANVQEFLHENVLTSRSLRRASQGTANHGAAQRSRKAKQERLELQQSMIVNALPQASRDTARSGLHFLLTEVSVGLTLAAVAESKNGLEAARTRARVRAAYDCVVRFADRVSVTQKERKELLTALNKLKRRLQALGERF